MNAVEKPTSETSFTSKHPDTMDNIQHYSYKAVNPDCQVV
jgi:hypothetical protein